MNRSPIDRRIPRPQGTTLKAREKRTQEVHESLADAFVRGLFPVGQPQLSMYQFASLYNIPIPVIERKVKDGMASNLLDGDDSLQEKLERERLKLFSASLFRIGNSDRQIQNLVTYLSNRVLSNPSSSSFMIKELNSVLTSAIKNNETGLKAVQMMNDALVAAGQNPELDAGDQLTREELIEEVSRMTLDQASFEKYLEGTPNVTPNTITKREKLLKPGTDSYIKDPQVAKTDLPAEAVILAK